MNFPITRVQRIDWIKRSIEPHLGLMPEADEYFRHAHMPGFNIAYSVDTFADGRRQTLLRIFAQNESDPESQLTPMPVFEVSWDEAGNIKDELFRGGAWEGRLRDLCARPAISIIML